MLQLRAKAVEFYGAGANDIKLMGHAKYHGDAHAFCKDVADQIPYRIIGESPVVTFQFVGEHSADDMDWKLSCTVEGHYLRALGVDMKTLGVANKNSPDSDTWLFNAYDQNKVIFTKYVDGPADSDILNSEANIISDVVAFHDRVNVTTEIITEET